MRILLLTPFMPHRRAGHGTATVASRFIEYFGPRHQLSVLTFYHDERELELCGELEKQCAQVIALPFPGTRWSRRQWIRARTAFGARPFLASLFDCGSMRRELEKLLEKQAFDLVQIDTTQMGPYVDLLRGKGLKKALVEIDVSMKPLRRRYEQEDSRLKRILHWREWRRMRRYEPALCRKFDLVYAVSEEDRQLLASTANGLTPALFRYGVDSDLFEIPINDHHNGVLLFFGSFIHPPNVDAANWFVHSIFGRIRAQAPQTKLYIVGGPLTASIESLAREPGVTVTGWVPDVRDYLSKADVCVVPLRHGGGVKLKTLEMMAAGRPVVTTSVGCEGINVEDGVHVLLASSPEEFASKTLALLRDPPRSRALGRNARVLVMREHRWSENLAEMERRYQRLVHGESASVIPASISAPSLSAVPSPELSRSVTRGS